MTWIQSAVIFTAKPCNLGMLKGGLVDAYENDES